MAIIRILLKNKPTKKAANIRQHGPVHSAAVFRGLVLLHGRGKQETQPYLLTEYHSLQALDRYRHSPEEHTCSAWTHLPDGLPAKVAAGNGLLLRSNILGGHRLSTHHVEKQLLVLGGFVFLIDAPVQAIFLTCPFSALPAQAART